MPRYVFNVLIALDQFVNALLGGYADETISYRSAVARDRGERWGCVLCKVLEWFEEDHCYKTVRSKRLSLFMRGMTT